MVGLGLRFVKGVRVLVGIDVKNVFYLNKTRFQRILFLPIFF